MGFLSKTYDRYRSGEPRIEELRIEEECYCRSKVLLTPSAKEYINSHCFGNNFIDRVLFNLNYRDSEVGLNTLNSVLSEAKERIKTDNEDEIPNWTKYAQFMLSDCDIWLITRKDFKHEISVFNRFTGEEEWYKIPKPEYITEKIHNHPSINDIDPNCEEIKIPVTPDYLAFYSSGNGIIVLVIDRIEDLCKKKGYDEDTKLLLYNKILLHEVIHSCLDLYRRHHGKIISHYSYWISPDGKYTEESIDNAIVLKCFEGKPEFDLIKSFIEDQPPYYNRGIELLNSPESLLEKMLDNLISHKLISNALVHSVGEMIKGIYPLKKVKRNANIYVLDDGIKIYLKNNLEEGSSPWTDISNNLLNDFDYFVFNIKNKSFLLIPNPVLKELLKEVSFKDGKYHVRVILTEDDVKLVTKEGKENLSLKEYFHVIKD